MFSFKQAGSARTVSACLLSASHVPLAAATQGQAVINPLATLGKLAAALIVVLIVFWVFARVMRQMQGLQGGMNQGLKVISALSVGQRERVVVIQAGEEQLVLGVTSTQINTLHVLDNPLSTPATPNEQSDFKTKLSDALKRQVSS
jgi:flagellar protein FliO/FliZ